MKRNPLINRLAQRRASREPEDFNRPLVFCILMCASIAGALLLFGGPR